MSSWGLCLTLTGSYWQQLSKEVCVFFHITIILETSGSWLVWSPQDIINSIINIPAPIFLKTHFTIMAACHLKEQPPFHTQFCRPCRSKKRKEDGGGGEKKEREGRGGRKKGKETEGNIWKMLMFPAGFYLCLLYCHVIISNSKEDWEIFLDKHIASLNKIKVLWVRKKKKTYSRREAGSILGKQQSTMEV